MLKIPPRTVDEYLATLPEDQRAALDKLRKHILSLAPGAEELIRYDVPAVRLGGEVLLAYGALDEGCALYPMSPSWIKAHHAELAGFPTRKGTIRFQPDKPLPPALVRDLVKTRMAQSAARIAAAARR